VGTHLENPRAPGAVDAHVDTPVTVPADELPGGERDTAYLGGDLRRQICGTARGCSEVLLAAGEPFRLIGHDAPLSAGHRAEVDLGDGKHRLPKNADVDLATIDIAL